MAWRSDLFCVCLKPEEERIILSQRELSWTVSLKLDPQRILFFEKKGVNRKHRIGFLIHFAGTFFWRGKNPRCSFLLSIQWCRSITVSVSSGHRQSRTMAQYRYRSTGSARRRYLRDRACRLAWTLLGRAVASHVQVVTRHGWRRSPSSGVGRSAVSVSSGHRLSRTMASFTLLLLLAFPLLLLLLPPSQALGRASFLVAWTLRRWHSSHSSFLHVSTL